MSADPKDVDFDVLELLEQRKRNDIIEECAKILETFMVDHRWRENMETTAALIDAAAAIRALKS